MATGCGGADPVAGRRHGLGGRHWDTAAAGHSVFGAVAAAGCGNLRGAAVPDPATAGPDPAVAGRGGRGRWARQAFPFFNFLLD